MKRLEREPVATALERWLAPLAPLGAEDVMADQALGRVLARTVYAQTPVPAFHRSAVDGYAVRASECVVAGAGPVLAGALHAGSDAPPLAPGTAMYVATGAMLPQGADAVVPVELGEAVLADDGSPVERLRVRHAVGTGDNVRWAAQDLPIGAPALSAGCRVGPEHLPLLLASCPGTPVAVRKHPRVSILVTGDELCAPEGHPARIVDVVGPTLRALAERVGCAVRLWPPVPDDPDRLRDALVRAAQSSDAVVTVGGTSVGRRDHMPQTLREAGGTLTFHGLFLRPGTPALAGHLNGAAVLGLPGNPVAAVTVWDLFGRALVAHLSGTPQSRPLTARLSSHSVKRPVRDDRYLRASVWEEAGVLRAAIYPDQNAGMLAPMARTNALALHPAGVDRLARGDEVTVWLLGALGGQAPEWLQPQGVPTVPEQTP